jgi:hypothetical protein
MHHRPDFVSLEILHAQPSVFVASADELPLPKRPALEFSDSILTAPESHPAIVSYILGICARHRII